MKFHNRKSKISVVDYTKLVNPPACGQSEGLGKGAADAAGQTLGITEPPSAPLNTPPKEPDELEFQIWAAKNGLVMV